jgi:hypothetical protein
MDTTVHIFEVEKSRGRQSNLRHDPVKATIPLTGKGEREAPKTLQGGEREAVAQNTA